MSTDAERFWAKVAKGDGDACWNWTGSKKKGGRALPYGFIKFDGKTRTAHRVAWFMATGEWPELLVRHRCDNASCVRFDHLELGTQTDNIADMVDKGRSTKGRRSPNKRPGELSPNAKLTESAVRAIRAAAGASTAELARRFGVSEKTITLAVTRQTWRHVA